MLKFKHINYWFILLLLLGLSACSDSNSDNEDLSSSLSVTPLSLRFKESKTDTVLINYDEKWEASLSDTTWCRLDKSSGKGKGEIVVTLKSRNSVDLKATKLIVRATDKPSILQVVNLLLDGTDFYTDPIAVEFGLGDNATYAVDVVCEGGWTATLNDESWCTLDKTSGNGNGKIQVSSHFDMANFGGKNAVLTISSTENPEMKTTVDIKQIEEFKHESCFTLNKATKGKGINLLITGDGFTQKHMGKNGHWQKVLKRCEDAIFSYEPYASFREYFNVYAVTAVSATDVFKENEPSNTFFGTYFMNQITFTKPGANVAGFTLENSPLKEAAIEGKDVTVLLVINVNRYCGVAQLSGSDPSIGMGGLWDGEGRIEDPFSTMIAHEFLGHAFGKLSDEYYADNKRITEEEITIAKRERNEFGHWQNIEFTNNPAKFDNKYWQKLLEMNYPDVGIIQGGRYCQYGVYRSINNNTMKDQNTARFFGPVNREIILRQIYKLAGMESEYNLNVFLEYDKRNLKN